MRRHFFAGSISIACAVACTTGGEGNPSALLPGAVDSGADARDADGDIAGRSCSADADCGDSNRFGCGYPIADGCSAKGICVLRQSGFCSGVEICACDGTLTFGGCGFDSTVGYASKPVVSPTRYGACAVDSGLDAPSD